jgi:hypothetical protein
MNKLKRYYYTVVVYILILWRNYCAKKYSKLLIKLTTEKNKYPSINEYNELDKNNKLTYYWNESWRYGGGTGTASFIPYKPTGDSSRMVLVYLDENTNPALIAGGGVLLVAIGFAGAGAASMASTSSPAPNETIESIRRDIRVIRGQK